MNGTFYRQRPKHAGQVVEEWGVARGDERGEGGGVNQVIKSASIETKDTCIKYHRSLAEA